MQQINPVWTFKTFEKTDKFVDASKEDMILCEPNGRYKKEV